MVEPATHRPPVSDTGLTPRRGRVTVSGWGPREGSVWDGKGPGTGLSPVPMRPENQHRASTGYFTDRDGDR